MQLRIRTGIDLREALPAAWERKHLAGIDLVEDLAYKGRSDELAGDAWRRPYQSTHPSDVLWQNPNQIPDYADALYLRASWR